MPILKREADIYPEDLFDLPEAEFPWQVVHVRSRQEKVLVRHLATPSPGNAALVPYYLPQAGSRKMSGGRMRTSWIPLFPGYVFIRGDAKARQKAVLSGVVANVIPVPDQQQLSSELRQIRELQLKGARFLPHPLVVGEPVTIREGVFRGYTGVVEREKGETRLVVRVSMLAKAVVVELDRDDLTRLGKR